MTRKPAIACVARYNMGNNAALTARQRFAWGHVARLSWAVLGTAAVALCLSYTTTEIVGLGLYEIV